MTSRPHVFSLRSSDDRRLAAALMGRPDVAAVELSGSAGPGGTNGVSPLSNGVSPRKTGLSVRTTDYGAFTRQIAVLARAEGIRLRELQPTDESLESVFGYLIGASPNAS
jgi:ABC-2 type transport system ATP-binding protein